MLPHSSPWFAFYPAYHILSFCICTPRHGFVLGHRKTPHASSAYPSATMFIVFLYSFVFTYLRCVFLVACPLTPYPTPTRPLPYIHRHTRIHHVTYVPLWSYEFYQSCHNKYHCFVHQSYIRMVFINGVDFKCKLDASTYIHISIEENLDVQMRSEAPLPVKSHYLYVWL